MIQVNKLLLFYLFSLFFILVLGLDMRSIYRPIFIPSEKVCFFYIEPFKKIYNNNNIYIAFLFCLAPINKCLYIQINLRFGFHHNWRACDHVLSFSICWSCHCWSSTMLDTVDDHSNFIRTRYNDNRNINFQEWIYYFRNNK